MELDLKTLAERVGGRLDGPADVVVRGVAGIEEAGEGDCTFLGSPKYAPHLETTRASAVIVAEGVDCAIPAIRVQDPQVAFLMALRLFERPRAELFPPGIHATAVIDPSARLGDGVHVGPHAVVSAGCAVGRGSVIGAGTVLMADVSVGEGTLLYPNVSVREECEIGNRVIVHCGTVIGSDGFGFAREKTAVHKIPQIGRVVIEDDVEIGANVCIDRATTGITRIESGAKIDNLVQIAHNVRIGPRTALSAQTGISGSTRVGSDVIMGGQVGVADHVTIGDRVMIAAKSGVRGKVRDGEILAGIPARDHREWRRNSALQNRLGRYAEEIAELRRRLDELENS